MNRARPNPAHVTLYQRAMICRRFPAYTLRTLREEPILEILDAVKLLDLADKVHS
jgi:hypothetical protein